MVKITNGVSIKTEKELKIMEEGGKILREVKKELRRSSKPGVNAMEIEKLATRLISDAGAKPSFKMVPDYHWSTCINVNAGLVHGIPKKSIVFKKGDLISIDVGVYYKGFHTDTSISFAIESSPNVEKFLKVGEKALNNAIKEARIGRRIYDISEAIEKTLTKENLSPIKSLVGHGVGKELHEDPYIPCFTQGRKKDTFKLVEGMAIAIEVMYALGSSSVGLADDEWTILMRDGKISGLFEETVAITANGPKVLT